MKYRESIGWLYFLQSPAAAQPQSLVCLCFQSPTTTSFLCGLLIVNLSREKGGYWGTAIVSERAQWTEREKWQALSMDFHSHARRFFNHLFDSELGLRVHRQAGDLIRHWDIIYLRVKLVTPFLQQFNTGHILCVLFK
jgi:hypothetical protein